MSPIPEDAWRRLIELGAAILGLAVLARGANRWALPAAPVYLLAGLAFGKGGLAPLNFSRDFVQIGADIGILLLLFMLGLEYTGEELARNLRTGLGAGVADFVLNFPLGLIAGLLLGWKLLPSVLLGGVTYVSSSGMAAKLLADLGRIANPETPSVVSVLVLEDLAMAVFLPIAGVLIAGGTIGASIASVAVALAVVSAALVIAVKFGRVLSRFAAHQSDEVILLTVLGTILLVAGTAQRFQVSAAIGAFLVGIAVSGPIAEQSYRLLAPLRDLFAATFFFFFGLGIDPATLPRVLPFAISLGLATALTKVLTGSWAARHTAEGRKGRIRAGTALVAHGEFSIVAAALGSTIEPELGPLSAAYVLIMAILGAVLARVSK
jgi:CPA2 family monovalent cation:H+ antiporter-2